MGYEGNRPPAPPQSSPDGRWWWDGQRWVPVVYTQPAARPRRPRSSRPLWIVLAAATAFVIGTTAVAATTTVLPAGLRTVILGGGTPTPVVYIATVPPPGAGAIPAADAPAPPLRAPFDTAAVTAQLKPETVRLDTQLHYGQGPSGGTGIILSPNGLVLTDEHVTYEADSIAAQVGGTGRTYDAAMIGADPADDVALIQLKGASGLTPAKFGDVSSAHVGDDVLAMGYPDQTLVTHRGRISDEGVSITTQPDGDAPGKNLTNMLETASVSEAGMSGGPVVDSSGRVLGVVESGDQNITDSVRAEVALRIARQIAAGEAGPRIVIGLPADLGAVATDALDANGRSSGAAIVRVRAHSPAQLLGLQVGHTVTKVDGTDVRSALDLQLALVPHHPGDRITLYWSDGFGLPHHGAITLARGPGP